MIRQARRTPQTTSFLPMPENDQNFHITVACTVAVARMVAAPFLFWPIIRTGPMIVMQE
jgi:hypothetical protein